MQIGPIKHGTRRGYQRKCRCDKCSVAQTRYFREYAERRKSGLRVFRRRNSDGIMHEFDRPIVLESEAEPVDTSFEAWSERRRSDGYPVPAFLRLQSNVHEITL